MITFTPYLKKTKICVIFQSVQLVYMVTTVYISVHMDSTGSVVTPNVLRLVQGGLLVIGPKGVN